LLFHRFSRTGLVPRIRFPFPSANVGHGEGRRRGLDGFQPPDLGHAIFAYQSQNLEGGQAMGKREREGGGTDLVVDWKPMPALQVIESEPRVERMCNPIEKRLPPG